MFDALRNNALQQVDVVEALINTHEMYATAQTGERERLVKQYAVASCVTRLYAIYEWFVETLLADYLDALPELISYADLPDGLKVEYRMGISHLLSKVESGRYSHLKHENVIRWYHEALTGGTVYRFVAEALTRHNQNLRLAVLEGLTARVALPNLRGWLGQSTDILDLYVGESRVVELLEAELKELVQARNDASHGLLLDLLGASILERYCALVRGLINSLAAYGHWHLLQKRTAAGKMKHIGRVTEVFKKAGAVIVQLHAGAELSVGNSLHFASNSYCLMQAVASIRLDDVDTNQITVSNDGCEIGIGCAQLPRKNSDVYTSAA